MVYDHPCARISAAVCVSAAVAFAPGRSVFRAAVTSSAEVDSSGFHVWSSKRTTWRPSLVVAISSAGRKKETTRKRTAGANIRFIALILLFQPLLLRYVDPERRVRRSGEFHGSVLLALLVDKRSLND